MKTPAYIWHNGRIKPWQDASVSVGAHALHYGSSVFEGERVLCHAAGTDVLPPARPHRTVVPFRARL